MKYSNYFSITKQMKIIFAFVLCMFLGICFSSKVSAHNSEVLGVTDISDTQICLMGQSSYNYTGEEIKPNAIIIGKVVYLPEVDYTVVYKSNKEPGTAKIVIEGKGRLYGSRTYTFKIKKPSVKVPTMTLSGTEAETLNVSVDYLKGATGYQIEYADNWELDNSQKLILTNSADGASKDIDGLTIGQNYYFRARAYKTVAGKHFYGDYTEIIYTYAPDYEFIESWVVNEGITTPMAYESRKGITKEPSYSYTWAKSNTVDENTGIVMNEYGDYMCAMGTHFGYCGDRFKITLDDGSYFTVQIGDSKGDREYHPFGLDGYCIVEFIIDVNVATKVAPSAFVSGTYTSVYPFGSNIAQIDKIA